MAAANRMVAATEIYFQDKMKLGFSLFCRVASILAFSRSPTAVNSILSIVSKTSSPSENNHNTVL